MWSFLGLIYFRIMKTTLFLAITADGFIAKKDDDVTWSDDHWKNYFEYCKEIGNLMVGRKTYDLMLEANELDQLTLKNLVIISEKMKISDALSVCATSPELGLDYLIDKNCEEVIIGGGQKLNNYMLSNDLIDEIQLDVEATLYGSGVPLFGQLKSEKKLKLKTVRKSGLNTVRLHYIVDKR